MKKRASSSGKKNPVTRKPRSDSRRPPQKDNLAGGHTAELPNGEAGRMQQGLHASGAPVFRMESKPKRYVPIMAIVIALCITSLYFYFDILLKLHNYYTLILVFPLYGYILGDLFLWLRNGVRSLEMDAGELRLTLPNGQPMKRIGKNEIGSVRITSTIDGRTVFILLHGATVSRFLWMSFFSGPRVRIPEAPFSKGDFAEFVERLGSIATVVR